MQVKAASKRKALNLQFHGAKDHLDASMHEYKVQSALHLRTVDTKTFLL